jgi:hypothetical protein
MPHLRVSSKVGLSSFLRQLAQDMHQCNCAATKIKVVRLARLLQGTAVKHAGWGEMGAGNATYQASDCLQIAPVQSPLGYGGPRWSGPNIAIGE